MKELWHDEPVTPDEPANVAPLQHARRMLELAEVERETQRLRLKEACLAAAARVGATGITSGDAARRTGLNDSLIRRLTADGEISGWRPPSRNTCEEIDALGNDLTMRLGLTEAWEAYDAAAKDVRKARNAVRRVEVQVDLADQDGGKAATETTPRVRANGLFRGVFGR